MIKTPESFLLKSTVQLVFLLVNIVSVYLLFRGHNLPGGGFIGGLMTGISFILLGLSKGWNLMRKELPIDPMKLAAIGVTIAVLTGLVPFFMGEAFLTQYNWHWDNLPLLGNFAIGTPFVFDCGVYFLVVGMTIKLVTVLVRSTSLQPPFGPEEMKYYASILEAPIEDKDYQKEVNDAD